MYIKELTNKEFSDFTKSYPLFSIYQTQEYAFIMNKQNYDSIFLGLCDNNHILAATLILIEKDNGFKYAYAPRGFLLNYDDFYLLSDFTNHLKDYLNKKGVIAIKVNPLIIRNICDFKKQNLIPNPKFEQIFESFKHLGYYHFGYNNFFEALKPRFEAIIDLKKPVNVLFNNIRKEFKTKIRSAINNGIEIYKGNIDQLDYLYEQTKKKYPRNLEYFRDCYQYFSANDMIDYYYTKLNTATYLKYTQNELSKYEQLSNDISSELMSKSRQKPQNLINKKINIDKYLNKYQKQLVEATKLLRDNPDGIVTSTILVVKHHNEATILIDAHDPKYRNFNSKHLLIWQLIKMYSENGFDRFNLGGLSNVIIDTKKYTGLNEFKLSFGSLVYEYIGDLELITNKRGYNMYRNYVPLKNLIKSKLTK